MANGYYYLISSLPELNLTDKNVRFDLVSYRDVIREALDPKDAHLVKTLFYVYDITNLTNLIKKSDAPWKKAGNYSRVQFESMLQDPNSLPDFLPQFYDETVAEWEDWSIKQLFNHAMTFYIDWARKTPNQFLLQWLEFRQNLKNLLVYLNCNKFKLDVKKEVLGNNDEAQFLRETNLQNLKLDWWDMPAKKVWALFDNPNIALREFLIDEIRWNYLIELEEKYSFGIERLLAFAIRLDIINRNIIDTEEGGRERLKNLMLGMRKDYTMPETFN